MPEIEKPTFCTAILRVKTTSWTEGRNAKEYECDVVGAHELRDGRKVHRNMDKEALWVGDR